MFNKKKKEALIRDGFVNLQNFISNRAKSVINQFETKNILNNQNKIFEETQLNYNQLGNLYINNPWVNRAITVIVEEMFKNGFNINLDDKKEQEAFEKYLRHNYIPLLKKACVDSLVYGGGLLMKQDYSQNVKDEFRFNKNSELFHIPYDMYSVLPSYIPNTFIYNGVGSFIVSGNLKQNNINQVIAQSPNALSEKSINKSFFISFKGIDAIYPLLPRYKYQGASLLAPNIDNIKTDLIILEAIANSVFRNGTVIFQHQELLNKLQGSEESAIAFFQRLELLNSGLNSTSMAQIDAEENLITLNIPLNEYKELSNLVLARLAGYFGLSLTKLLGRPPEGMNSTGEADIYHDTQTIEMWQEHFYKQTKEVIEFAYGKFFGEYKEVEFEFNCPYSMTQQQELEMEQRVISNAIMLDNALSSTNGLEYLYKKGLVDGEDYNRLKLEAEEMEQIDEESERDKDI